MDTHGIVHTGCLGGVSSDVCAGLQYTGYRGKGHQKRFLRFSQPFLRTDMQLAETLKEFNSTVVVTVAALVMGVLMKYITKLSERRKDNLNEHLELRKELREELDTVKDELRQLQKDIDDWREKYYHQVEVNAVLQSQISALRLELTDYQERSGEHTMKDIEIL
jgi:uncharacterized protein YlxW (UPF0749 family)